MDDEILTVAGTPVVGLLHNEIIALFKQSGLEITLEVRFSSRTPEVRFSSRTPEVGFSSRTPEVGFSSRTPEVDFHLVPRSSLL